MSIIGILRTVAGAIDSILYKFASTLFGVIFDIAGHEVFTSDQISDIARRIYIVVGVLMLFKLVIAAIQYMVNPDAFDDKEKGMVGLLKKTAISIALITIVPSIFNFAIYMEKIVIESLPNIILGQKLDDADKQTIGSKLSFSLLHSFVTIHPKTSTNGITDTNDEIVDIDSFVNKLPENCQNAVLWGQPDTRECKYDYMWPVSTICGGFLCYVLLIMVFDVVIRTIKFGIIQMLAPIPISSYVFSKDKLTKFAKTALHVYVDLFIRLAIIILVIATIKELSQTPFFNTSTGDWFKDAIIKLALILGLLMFAKNAPKFITDLLGIQDIGSGDFADMFKPTRLSSAFGALANPIRGAVANSRAAWDNSVDMNRGKRIADALRHGIGGFARGAADGAAGVYNGEDWGKIDQRLNKALDKSKKRSAAAFMRRTAGKDASEMNEEVKKRKAQIEAEWKSAGIDINEMLKNSKTKARELFNSELKAKDEYLNTLRKKISTGLDESGNTLSESQIQSLRTELATKQQERDAFVASEEEYINKKSKEIYDSSIDDAVTNTIKAKKDKRTKNLQSIAEKRNELANPKLTQAQRKKKEDELFALMSENDELEMELSDENKLAQDLRNEYVKSAMEYDELLNEKYRTVFGKDIQVKEKPAISWQTIASGKVDKFFGGEGFTGQGYIDTAELLKNNRSSLYTGESMTKMRQNANVLVDEKGNEATFEVKFTNGKLGSDGKPIRYSYSYVADLKRRADAGDPTLDLKKEGFENSAMLQSAFEDMEKQAAEAYVTANVAANDPSVKSEWKLRNGYKPNLTIIEGISRLKAQLAAANIPKDEKNRLLKELSENPGKFFKGASDEQEVLRTRGSRISAYNSGKKDSGS